MKKLVIANWKMNPQTAPEARRIFSSIEQRMHNINHTEVVICAPSIFIAPLSYSAHRTNLGAQNVSWAAEGSLTGEVSVNQLELFNVRYIILGHSERRINLGETDEMVKQKISIILKHKMVPVVCLGGEKGANKSDMKKIITKQFKTAISSLDKKELLKCVFVYEPVWAISTVKNSKPATGQHAQEMILFIQNMLAKKVGKDHAKHVRILYGGTVNKNNVNQYAKYPEIDGALVGAASLDPDNFWEVIKEFDREAVHRV